NRNMSLPNIRRCILNGIKSFQQIGTLSNAQFRNRKTLYCYASMTRSPNKHFSRTLITVCIRNDIMNRVTLTSILRNKGPQTLTSMRLYTVNENAESDVKIRGIQKTISPLTTKRPGRRKKKDDVPLEQKESAMNAVAYATGEEYYLDKLIPALRTQGLYEIQELPSDIKADALHLTAKYHIDERDEMKREVFLFREGSVVCWNLPVEERNNLLTFLMPYSECAYDLNLVKHEKEQLECHFHESSTRLVSGDIYLKSGEENKVQRNLEKYAFSNALGLSVKLAIWEASLERYVDSIEWVTEAMRQGKEVNMSRSLVLKKYGEVLSLRHLINLSSDLLDTPDFYWDREGLEMLYQHSCAYLNIKGRTRVVNEKLNHCCELAELLSSHSNDKHHVRLEWMIIVLIMVEVLFEILHYVERYMDSQPAQSVEQPTQS
ncbi:unnamed protein product, partial [Owenia fusiformis]